MPIFKSRFVENAETIGAKLSKARTRVAALEAELRSKAYDAALTDDPDASLASVRDQILVARLTVEALQHAIVEARRLEAGRVEKARFAARKAEFNAWKQHASALQRACDAYARVAGELQGCWNAIVDAAERAQRLVPNPSLEYPELHPHKLAARGELELARIGRRGEFWGPELVGHSAPGAMAGAVGIGVVPTELPSFSAGMAEVLANYSAQFKASLSLPTPAPESTVTIPLPTRTEPPAAPEPPPAAEPVLPHPEGSAEAAAYEAALAQMRPAAEPILEIEDV